MSRALRVITTILVALAISGCSSSKISGMFVTQSSSEVDLLDLVEAPAGHLSGTLVISAINKNGNRKKDVVSGVSGSFYDNNVSLKIGSDGIFTNSVNAIGTLNGSEIRLEIGGNPLILKRTTKRKYGLALVSLNESGDKLKQKLATIKSVKDLSAYLAQLDTNLQSFVGWGNDRIAHVPHVREWYANRVSAYQRCVNSVMPLALRRVPSWRWQSCVQDMDNDSFERQQMSESIAEIQRKSQTDEQGLNTKIANLSGKIMEAANLWDQACPLSMNEAACKTEVNNFKNETPSALLIMHINEYKNILPQLQSAVDTDVQAKAEGEKKLFDLVNEADNLLRNAN